MTPPKDYTAYALVALQNNLDLSRGKQLRRAKQIILLSTKLN